MTKALGERLVLAIITCLLGAGITILSFRPAATMDKSTPNEIRMRVDPTVLPTVLPPDERTQAKESTEPNDLAKEKDSDKISPIPQKDSPTKKNVPVTATNTAKADPIPKTMNHTGSVTGLALQQTSTNCTLTVTSDQPVGDTSYINLTNPKRLVVDLHQPWQLKTNNVIRAEQGSVKYVVVGTHPDRLRFVFHFRTQSEGQMTPSISKQGSKTIISVDLP